ncbi:hypothetical protein [Oryzihumus leptocrescens]|uniref:hypothetical protein n=1 Tax=Oryzihumus leptocrescens TaxID=297536 RepID=UPI001C8AA310|nr:hypothetical protein [Oryzihumus leptocrescens]
MVKVGGQLGGKPWQVFVPGMLVQLGIFGAMFVGFGLVAEYRAGVIESMRVTPASRTSSRAPARSSAASSTRRRAGGAWAGRWPSSPRHVVRHADLPQGVRLTLANPRGHLFACVSALPGARNAGEAVFGRGGLG